MEISRKSTLTTLCAVMIGLFFAVGCKKDDPKGPIEGTGDVDYPIDVLYEEYSLAPSCQWANLAYDNKVIIINSYEELQQYVVCPNKGTSEIDFSKQTLLLANGTSSGGISEITVTSLQQLAPNGYALELEILLDDSAVDEERWVVALIVDKVGEESTVELKFTEYPIEIPFTEYSLIDTSCQWLYNSPFGFDEIIIINSDHELENYIVELENYYICTDDSSPEINFSEYSLICARGMASSSPADVIKKQLLQISNNEYSLDIIIRPGPSPAFVPWLISITVPKLSQDAVIALNINLP